MIWERPAEVETRDQAGHWEIDTVMGAGSKDCIVSLVERKSGLLLIGKLADRTTASLNRRVIRLIRRDEAAFATVTADNGTEFHDYRRIEARTKALFYFARPYHSWERGAMKTPTGSSASICRKEPVWRASVSNSATLSLAGSTQGHASVSASKRRSNASMNFSQCCGSNLMSGAAFATLPRFTSHS